MAITMGEIEGVERQLERLEEALDKGLRLIQVRDKGWPVAQRLWFAEAVTRIARQRGALVLINDDEEIARQVGADGVNLSATRLKACARRPDFNWVGASCHTAGELARAAELGLDYALLSPVLPTPTHPERHKPRLGRIFKPDRRLSAAGVRARRHEERHAGRGAGARRARHRAYAGLVASGTSLPGSFFSSCTGIR